MPRAPACDKLRCERLSSFVSGLDVRDWGLAEPERSWGTAGEEDSPGRGVSTPERADLLVLSDDAAVPATLCYQSSGRCSTYRICTTSATSTDCLDRAPQQVLYIPLLCGHRNKTPREAAQ